MGKRTPRHAAAVLVAMLGAALPAQAQPYRLAAVDASSLPTVRAVLDRANVKEPLEPSGFRLVEGDATTNAATHLRSLGETDMALAIVVAVDVSGSMRGRPLDAIRRGIASLATRKRGGDRIAVLTFADDIRWDAAWGATAAALTGAFTNVEARGRHTRLYDAVVSAIDEFDEREKTDSTFPRRQVLLVVSDGHDEGSEQGRDALAKRVKTSRVRLDAIGLAASPAWLRNLQALSRAGFGQFRTAASPEQLTRLLETGIDDTLATPVLEFTAEKVRADGQTHTLGVRHEASGWSGTVAVIVPEAGFLTGNMPARRYLTAATIALGAVAIGALLWHSTRRRRQRAARLVIRPSHAMPVHEAPVGAASGVGLGPATAPSMPRRDTVAVTASARQPTRLVTGVNDSRGRMRLTFDAGPHAGESFGFEGSDVSIGSSPSNQLCLAKDNAVSGHHARISTRGGLYHLHDNGSLNHTWLNGTRVAEATPLQAGDRIRVGRSECTFDIEPVRHP